MTTNTKSPTVLPLRPVVRLTALEVRVINALTRHAPELTIRLGGPDQIWRCALSVANHLSQHSDGDVFAHLEWDSATLAVQLPRNAIQAWLEGYLPDVQLPRLPDALFTAALNSWLNQILGEIPDTTRRAVRIINQTSDPGSVNRTELRHAWMLAMHSTSTTRVVLVTLFLSDLALHRLYEHVRHLPKTPGPIDIGTIAVSVTARVGQTRLQIPVLRSLQQGDVVMLDRCYISPDGQLWLHISHNAGVRIRSESGRYIVTEGWKTFMNETSTDLPEEDALAAIPDAASIVRPELDNTALPESSNPDAVKQNQPLQDLDDVTVTLSFDLGQRQYSLADLQALKPGKVFDLAQPLNDSPVYIRANNTLIGAGELVDIDGRVGVQVTRLGNEQ